MERKNRDLCSVMRSATTAPRSERSGFGLREKHVGGLEILALAVVEVKNQIVFGDEVTGVKTEEAGSLIDGVMGTFEFNKGADGGFVEVDKQAFCPFEAGREGVGSAELLIPEPATQAESFKDPLDRGSVMEGSFKFFADLVPAVGRRGGWTDGKLLGRGFESEDVAACRSLQRGLLPFCFCAGLTRGDFGANAEKLAVFG